MDTSSDSLVTVFSDRRISGVPLGRLAGSANHWSRPTKRASKIRRRLTYVTLFIASCVLIGDFTYVVYSFLGGELTVRFVLKALVVAVIAGTAFGYYLWDLRANEREPET